MVKMLFPWLTLVASFLETPHIGVGILYPPIGVLHRYDDTTFQQFICYGHKSIGKYVLKFTKLSVSFAFLRN